MGFKDPKKQREYQRLWRAKRKDDFFSDKCCKHCGTQLHLELHHRISNQKISHNIWSWSEIRRRIELLKCDVLCRSCHLEETLKQRNRQNSQLAHNAMTYIKYHCRCDKCCDAYKTKNRINARKRRERLRNNTITAPKKIVFNGEEKTIPEWSKVIGISYFALKYRLNNGWNIEKALTTPSRHYFKDL